jgi:FixJ family two-component response regulator
MDIGRNNAMVNLGRVIVVQRPSRTRDALSKIAAQTGHAVRTFDSIEDFRAQDDERDPGCLLVALGDGDSISLAFQLRSAALCAQRPMIFVAEKSDIETSVQAMKYGAVDFMRQPIDEKRLLEAIERGVARDIEQRTERSINSIIMHRLASLTVRELQVMTHIIGGRLNKQIAADLGPREKTIKVHRARVMDKMDVQSVAELVQMAARVGISLQPALSSGSSKLNWTQVQGPPLRSPPMHMSARSMHETELAQAGLV